MRVSVVLFGIVALALSGAGSCKRQDEPAPSQAYFTLNTYTVEGKERQDMYHDVSLLPEISLSFNDKVDHHSVQAGILLTNGSNIALNFGYSHNDSTVVVRPAVFLSYLTQYQVKITSDLLSQAKSRLSGGVTIKLVTQLDSTDKFPHIDDSALLDSVQRSTIRYFYEFAEPHSGMARERDQSGELVTSGGSGFGLMALVAGIEHGYIPRTDGINRFNRIVSFLESADRFHGAWSHWINGSTGKVIPFSASDNGADLVETSYLAQGLITVREYLKRTPADTSGNNLIRRIDSLWQSIEFDWFLHDQKVLYWHWSPDKGWVMNMPIKGYNEALIVYILAAGSPTHSITADVYQEGWASGGAIRNGKVFYGHPLPLGEDYGGPLFFSHYSFLGFDPHTNDSYLNVSYWTQNVNHTLINHDYCVTNPSKFAGYGKDCWGLTASDNPWGYAAQSPTNDNGTISPTAAVSSIPYAPDEAMRAIRFFYYTMGDRLWGPYGFRDALNMNEGWVATTYLAIDQGPQVVMIENYRTGFFWKLFGAAPEVAIAKSRLGMN